MQVNVVKNAKRNILFGSINRIVVLLIPFIKRLIVLNVLGAQYLGLGSLFQSILSVLSLSELGFSSAVVYNMYKPAAEGNVTKMNALLNYYRRAYRFIGVVIFGVKQAFCCVGYDEKNRLQRSVRKTVISKGKIRGTQ